MAGNQSDDRKRAQQAYENAKRAGVKGSDLAKLEAAFKAAEAVEKSAIKAGGTRGWF